MTTHDIDIELPPLPKASKMYDIPGYDEEELKDYARAAVEADRQQRESIVTDDMRSAIRFAPFSAYWSDVLRDIFGPDAREGIDALERRLRDIEDARQRRDEPVAWRYLTPTGWHATTDAARALGIAEHHTVEPLYATPQSDDFSARLSRIEDSMKAGARLTKHRFKLDAPQPAEPVKVPSDDQWQTLIGWLDRRRHYPTVQITGKVAGDIADLLARYGGGTP